MGSCNYARLRQAIDMPLVHAPLTARASPPGCHLDRRAVSDTRRHKMTNSVTRAARDCHTADVAWGWREAAVVMLKTAAEWRRRVGSRSVTHRFGRPNGGLRRKRAPNPPYPPQLSARWTLKVVPLRRGHFLETAAVLVVGRVAHKMKAVFICPATAVRPCRRAGSWCCGLRLVARQTRSVPGWGGEIDNFAFPQRDLPDVGKCEVAGAAFRAVDGTAVRGECPRLGLVFNLPAKGCSIEKSQYPPFIAYSRKVTEGPIWPWTATPSPV